MQPAHWRSKIALLPGTSMLINCAAYQDGRKLADIKPEEISDYVSRPSIRDRLVALTPLQPRTA